MCLLKRAGKSRQTMPGPILMYVEGALGVGVEQGTTVGEICQTCERPGHTKDSVFDRLERIRVDPNLDDGYNFENERSAGSRESADLRARLNARRVRPEQQA